MFKNNFNHFSTTHNGCGIITIEQDLQTTFFEKLIRFYETGLKQWIYDNCIDGISLNNN